MVPIIILYGVLNVTSQTEASNAVYTLEPTYLVCAASMVNTHLHEYTIVYNPLCDHHYLQSVIVYVNQQRATPINNRFKNRVFAIGTVTDASVLNQICYSRTDCKNSNYVCSKHKCNLDLDIFRFLVYTLIVPCILVSALYVFSRGCIRPPESILPPPYENI